MSSLGLNSLGKPLQARETHIMSRVSYATYFVATAAFLATLAIHTPVTADEPIVILNREPADTEASEAPTLALGGSGPTAPHVGWPITVRAVELEKPTPGLAAAGPVPAPAAAPAPEAGPRQSLDRVRVIRAGRRNFQTQGDAPIVPARLPTNPALSRIECMAGCSPQRSPIVYEAPIISARTGQIAAPAGLKPIAALAPSPADANTITCVAGCYSTPKTYLARPAPAPVQQAALEPPKPVTLATLPQPNRATSAGRLIPSVAKIADVRKLRPRARTSAALASPRLPPRAWRTITTRVTLRQYLPARGRADSD